jgi:hypothetical protein
LLIFYLLPALWLIWDLQSPWRMIISPAITLSVWTMVGAVVGGLDAWLGWRELKTHRHELERLASRHEWNL